MTNHWKKLKALSLSEDKWSTAPPERKAQAMPEQKHTLEQTV